MDLHRLYELADRGLLAVITDHSSKDEEYWIVSFRHEEHGWANMVFKDCGPPDIEAVDTLVRAFCALIGREVLSIKDVRP